MNDPTNPTASDIEWLAQQLGALPTSLPDAKLPARTRQFLAELRELYEPEELPATLATLARAEHALRDKPADFDPMTLSLRELGPLIGAGELPDEVPGVTDKIPGAFDMPLRELDAKMGPLEFQYHVRKWGEALEAASAAQRPSP